MRISPLEARDEIVGQRVVETFFDFQRAFEQTVWKGIALRVDGDEFRNRCSGFGDDDFIARRHAFK
jgi:hypothetical protein